MNKDERRQKAEQLYSQHWSMKRIAQELGVTESTVQRDLSHSTLGKQNGTGVPQLADQ